MQMGTHFCFFFFLRGVSLLLSDDTAEVPAAAVDSSGLVLRGPAGWLARKRFSQATARRDNAVPRHSNPFALPVTSAEMKKKKRQVQTIQIKFTPFACREVKGGMEKEKLASCVFDFCRPKGSS
jgi:hypothetical protein